MEAQAPLEVVVPQVLQESPEAQGLPVSQAPMEHQAPAAPAGQMEVLEHLVQVVQVGHLEPAGQAGQAPGRMGHQVLRGRPRTPHRQEIRGRHKSPYPLGPMARLILLLSQVVILMAHPEQHT